MFVDFMRSTTGRGARIVAGIAIMIAGAGVVGGTSGLVIALVGLVPFFAGLFNFCLFAPLFGMNLIGQKTMGTELRA